MLTDTSYILKVDEKTNKLCYNINMTPNEDLVQYIEDELYKGVPISEVLYVVRSAGWQERQIQDAMTFLDRQHETMILDNMPPEPGFSFPKLVLNWRLAILASLGTFLAILLIVGLLNLLKSEPTPQTERFTDPNFSLQLPEGWHADQSYKPGDRVLFMQSPEDSSADAAQKIALVTIYPDASLDVFGKQLQSESADVELIRNETTKNGSVRMRFIEFRTLDFVSDGQITHGAFVLIDRGLVKMSAIVIVREEYWPLHAQNAELLLRSFMPGCSRPAADATQNQDGTISICGNEPVPDSKGTDILPN